MPPSEIRTNFLPSERAIGLPQAGFTHAGRADEAEHRSFHVVLQRTHSQEFKNALLYFLQVVMVFIEYLFGPYYIEAVGG